MIEIPTVEGWLSGLRQRSCFGFGHPGLFHRVSFSSGLALTTALPRLSYSRSKAADLRRLRRLKKVSVISGETRAVVESEVAYKLPPTKPQS